MVGTPDRWARISPEMDRHDPTHERLRGFVREWFPVLGDVQFTHAWGGPLGMPRDWHPTMAFDEATGIATARGYIGHGVSTTNLAGRVLTDLIAGARIPLTELPLVNHHSRVLGDRALPVHGCALRAVGHGTARREDSPHRQAAHRQEPGRADRVALAVAAGAIGVAFPVCNPVDT